MNNDDYFVNRLVQGGIYYFENGPVSKNRPYIIVSKDNGFGMDILCFVVTSQFSTSETCLPILMNGKIGFIRTSGTKEIKKSVINAGDFIGIVRPDIFDIAIRMHMKRIVQVDEELLQKDINVYLDTLERLKIPYRVNEKRIFKKSDFLNNEQISSDIPEKIPQKIITKAETNDKKMDVPKIDNIEQTIMNSSYWTVYRLKAFEENMRNNSNKELMKIYNIEMHVVKYLRNNIHNIIQKKKKFIGTKNRNNRK